VNSGNVGAVNSRLAVPRYEDEKLDASTLILADQIEHVPAKQIHGRAEAHVQAHLTG